MSARRKCVPQTAKAVFFAKAYPPGLTSDLSPLPSSQRTSVHALGRSTVRRKLPEHSRSSLGLARSVARWAGETRGGSDEGKTEGLDWRKREDPN